MRSLSLVVLLASGGALAGCLSTVEPPLPTPQASVAIPPRLYLVDASNYLDPMTSNDDSAACVRLFTPNPGAAVLPEDLIGPDTRSSTVAPFNCHIRLNNDNGERTLPVDAFEVTNIQYQLCVDSGACAEPDPSESDDDGLCASSNSFDDCPVVKVSPLEAQNYCTWVGRRLPSGYENTLMRQANLPIDSTGFPNVSELPLLPNEEGTAVNLIGYPCGQAVTGSGGCGRPSPVGTTPGDAVVVNEQRGSGAIFDLVGNVTELLRDRQPNFTEPVAWVGLPWEGSLPWFCAADLSEDDIRGRNCPNGETCIWATLDPDGPETAFDQDEYPLCVAHDGPVPGAFAIYSGASYLDDIAADDFQEITGYFARRSLFATAAQEIGETSLGREAGFRCVGQRGNAQPGFLAPDFTDLLEVTN